MKIRTQKFFKLSIIKLIILIIAGWFLVVLPVKAEQAVKLYFFYGDGCPHCAKEERFLENLSQDYPQLKIYSFEVWKNQDNLNLLKKAGEELAVNVSGVPFTIVGEKTISGYLNDQTTGQQIKLALDKCLIDGCPDIVGGIIEQEQAQTDNNQTAPAANLPEKINLPVFGEIELKKFSLPILTIMIGALDGFNPCAMWVLLFLISLLLGMADRKKMWILGFTFIAASAAVYFVFMAAWLNFLLFIGLVVWVRMIIGAVALISGYLNLKEYWKNKNAACKVTSSEKRRKIFDRLKHIVQHNKLSLALIGITLLAFSVNLVELICSAGLPAVYTQILALSNLGAASYYLYLLLYIFFFMLDDLLVFIIAMVTLQATGLTTRYTRLSYLIGGILMLIIGILLFFKPELLMFG